MMNPADIQTTDKERKQKEDSCDSRKIAKQLSQQDLKAIFVVKLRQSLTVAWLGTGRHSQKKQLGQSIG